MRGLFKEAEIIIFCLSIKILFQILCSVKNKIELVFSISRSGNDIDIFTLSSDQSIEVQTLFLAMVAVHGRAIQPATQPAILSSTHQFFWVLTVTFTVSFKNYQNRLWAKGVYLR